MTAVFLDLDGTLVDSKPGILSTLAAAFEEIGRPDLASGDLTWMIGPPFAETFEKLELDDPQSAIHAYRRIYDEGAMFDAALYDGVVEMIQLLREEERRPYLATAKPHVAARKITRHFGLAEAMVAEFGPELDGTRNWKGDLLKYALAETGETADRAVMVGDRRHDFSAAAFVGMPSIAVTWGYGTAEEWSEADLVIDHPSALQAALRELGL